MKRIGLLDGKLSVPWSNGLRLTRNTFGWFSASIPLRRLWSSLPLKKIPQVCTIVGGVVSPLLANIYLDKLDKYVEQQLIPAHTRGERRKDNAAYKSIKQKAARARKAGKT